MNLFTGNNENQPQASHSERLRDLTAPLEGSYVRVVDRSVYTFDRYREILSRAPLSQTVEQPSQDNVVPLTSHPRFTSAAETAQPVERLQPQVTNAFTEAVQAQVMKMVSEARARNESDTSMPAEGLDNVQETA